MKATIVGTTPILKGDKGKRSGQPYHCRNMHFTYKKRGVDGIATSAQFISFIEYPHALPFKTGDNVIIEFDDEGKFCGIEAAQIVKS